MADAPSRRISSRLTLPGANHRNQQLCLEAGVQVHAAAVDQQQGVAGPQIAQINRAHVTAHVVLCRRVLFVEGDSAVLRDCTEQFVAR
jgi:hypothetical protein